MRYAAIALLAALLVGCPGREKCQTVGDTRCEGQVAEICQDDKTWGTIEDCQATSANSGATFMCCFYAGDPEVGIPSGHTCLPPEDCNAADAGVADGNADL